jgi:polysaccharide biosynthesis protein PslF
LLGSGAGLLVPHKDPAAIADALRTLLTRRTLAAGMAEAGGGNGARADVAAVAARYRVLAERLIRDRVAA